MLAPVYMIDITKQLETHKRDKGKILEYEKCHMHKSQVIKRIHKDRG